VSWLLRLSALRCFTPRENMLAARVKYCYPIGSPPEEKRAHHFYSRLASLPACGSHTARFRILMLTFIALRWIGPPYLRERVEHYHPVRTLRSKIKKSFECSSFSNCVVRFQNFFCSCCWTLEQSSVQHKRILTNLLTATVNSKASLCVVKRCDILYFSCAFPPLFHRLPQSDSYLRACFTAVGHILAFMPCVGIAPWRGFYPIGRSIRLIILISSDGFTHRPNRPWPRPPRFLRPRASLSYDDSILTENLWNCAEA